MNAVIPLNPEGSARAMVKAMLAGDKPGFMAIAAHQEGQEVQAISYLLAPFEKMAAARAAGATNASEAGMKSWEWNPALFSLPEEDLYAACSLLKETHDGIKEGKVSPAAGYVVAMGRLASII